MDKLTKGWVHHLRKTARQETGNRGSCPLCASEIQPDIESFKAHVRADAAGHPNLANDADIEQAFKNVTINGSQRNQNASTRAPEATGPGRPHRKRPIPRHVYPGDPSDDADRQSGAGEQTEADRRGNKKICSPPASVTQERGSSPPTPGRSRARPDDGLNDFIRVRPPKNPGGRQLWSPDDDYRPKVPVSRHNQQSAFGLPRRPPQNRGSRHAQQHHVSSRSMSSDSVSPADMIRQPTTKPISQEQLMVEVKNIYGGLVLMEQKCIEYDSSQEANHLTQEQWHALIALHRSVLNEHHDFFLASHHPSADESLRRLASQHNMPKRLWRHGIHSFLELLRHKLPDSLEHMLTFIYIAYGMVSLLYETVPAFEDTWVESLGDLGRYRMAIEDDDIRDRETWTDVSRSWYLKAADISPNVGRLYHHLAILARPNELQQLYYFAKSLCAPIPFETTMESIMSLFDPLFRPTADSPLGPSSQHRLEPADAAFVRINGILYSGKFKEQLDSSVSEFLVLLDERIASARTAWLETGYIIGIILNCSLLGFGFQTNVLMRVISRQLDDTDSSSNGDYDEACDDETFQKALSFAIRTYEIVLRRWGDKNTLSCLHTMMVFLLHMSRHPAAMVHIEGVFPWKLTSIMLNYTLKTIQMKPRIETDEFPGPEKEGQAPRPLPEDYALRGLVYAEDYFPQSWFDERIEESDRYLEPPSKAIERQERMLWIGRRLANMGKWLTWDEENRQFSVTDAYNTLDEDCDKSNDLSGEVGESRLST
ncbi:hypothetical protein HIM_05399 [Hirsutella minnesotensis 3608]|uniref:DNA/RNA-binding domain-containing protein n=1 Tax=Hirsutella minnesotensis 3608 TaxID=1043627 RepID=A0A0F7ZPB4_9HYPO|nr:hypothetical protein HIM_05399 [Hirsutella minnesotensis 3608]